MRHSWGVARLLHDFVVVVIWSETTKGNAFPKPDQAMKRIAYPRHRGGIRAEVVRMHRKRTQCLEKSLGWGYIRLHCWDAPVPPNLWKEQPIVDVFTSSVTNIWVIRTSSRRATCRTGSSALWFRPCKDMLELFTASKIVGIPPDVAMIAGALMKSRRTRTSKMSAAESWIVKSLWWFLMAWTKHIAISAILLIRWIHHTLPKKTSHALLNTTVARMLLWDLEHHCQSTSFISSWRRSNVKQSATSLAILLPQAR